MMHLSRRRVAGGLAIAVTVVIAPTALRELTQVPRELPAWSADLVGAATATAVLLAAFIVLAGAVAWSGPHLAQAGRHLARVAPGRRDSTWWLLTTAVLVVVILATVALGLNYAHAISVSLANGQTGWQANLYPLTIDGLILGSSLALLWQRVHPAQATKVVWARVGFLAGLSFSGYTNVVYALHTPAETDQVTQLAWNVWPTLAFLITHEVLLWFVQRAVEGRPTIDPAELDAAQQAQQAAEQHAADAEQTATLAQEQATAAIDAANTDAEQRINRVQQQAEEQLEELRQQVTDVTRVRDEKIAEQDQQVTHLQHEQQQREADLASLRAQLDEIGQGDGTERTAADYAVLRDVITKHVERRRTVDGAAGSLTAEAVQIFGVSPRWVQQNIPDAPARRVREDEQDSLQLAAAG